MAEAYEQFKLQIKSWNVLDYTDLLVDLLPDGIIWIYDRFFLGEVIQDVIDNPDVWEDESSSPDIIQDVIDALGSTGNILRRLLSCFASELVRVQTDAFKLLNETDPGVATDLLEDWERVLGLPEKCFEDLSLTVEERQVIAHTKLFELGQTTSKSFYVEYAASLGFTITINEIPVDTAPRIMGVARMGVERMGGRGGYSILEITIVDGTSDNEILKCALNKAKQAHVIITWIEP